MGLCKGLNCCAGKKEETKKGDGDGKNGVKNGNATELNGKQPNGGGGEDGKGGSGDTPVYAKVDKNKKRPLSSASSCAASPTSPTTSLSSPPRKAEFLVSFVVDSRGSAMTGCRGSGLRLIIPPGAVEQPVRVTCRFIRNQGHQAIPPPPPLMERDALASGIIECGPVGAVFKLPVLVEIPYFASLGNGERELIVLRSEDGGAWKEHSTTATFADCGWDGQEGELYQDVVTSIDLKGVSEDLETGRIIRLSTTSFPKYFAVLSRIKGEVVTIGEEGGKVQASCSSSGPITVTFPPRALVKRIKIGLQLQGVPQDAVRLLDRQEGIVDVYPLVGIYPRRRKFHNPIQISLPVVSQERCEEVRKIWLLCSLSGANEPARWEDVSESASVEVCGKKLVFETRVSALFWIITTSQEYDPSVMLSISSALYKELSVSPYIARLTVFHRERFPYAWCDALRIYLSVNDRLDGYVESRHDGGDDGAPSPWTKLLDGREVEVSDRSVYIFDCKDNLAVARDCQMEARLVDHLKFNAFQGVNSLTLLVRWRRRDGGNGEDPLSTEQPRPASKTGYLVMKKQISVPGASARDAYHHGTWMLDARKDYEEIEVAPAAEAETAAAEHQSNGAKEEDEVVYDSVDPVVGKTAEIEKERTEDECPAPPSYDSVVEVDEAQNESEGRAGSSRGSGENGDGGAPPPAKKSSLTSVEINAKDLEVFGPSSSSSASGGVEASGVGVTDEDVQLAVRQMPSDPLGQ